MTVLEARRAVLKAGCTLQAREHVKELRALAASTGRQRYLAEAAELERTIDLADGVTRGAVIVEPDPEPVQVGLFGGAA